MKITISHDFNCDPETFWSKIFGNLEFDTALYRDELRFPGFEQLEARTDGDRMTRRCRITPRQDAPAPVQKLLGGQFSYIEEGSFDKKTQRYRFKIVPSSLADKLRIDGEMRSEPMGPGKMKRVAEINIEVKIFGLGGMVEGFVSRSMQDSYAQAAAFTNRWIASKGL